MEMAIVMARVCIMQHYLLIYRSTIPISSNNRSFLTLISQKQQNFRMQAWIGYFILTLMN